MTGFRAPRRS